MSTKLVLKDYIESEAVQTRIRELLKHRADQFMVSLTALTTATPTLQECEPKSLVGAVLTATAMDLPVNQNLGYVYLIPFKDRKAGITTVQLQFGYKAFIQLAMRSGQFKHIEAKPVYEGQISEDDSFMGITFNWRNKTSDKVVGYAGYFKLLNGFEKTLFMSLEDLKKHGLRYSQTFKKGYGLWEDNFEAMAIKTVLKLLLSKYAPLSIEMQKAVVTDQSAIYDLEGNEVKYIDNQKQTLKENNEEKELERVVNWIKDAKTETELAEVNKYVYDSNDADLIDLYEERLAEFNLDISA